MKSASLLPSSPVTSSYFAAGHEKTSLSRSPTSPRSLFPLPLPKRVKFTKPCPPKAGTRGPSTLRVSVSLSPGPDAEHRATSQYKARFRQLLLSFGEVGEGREVLCVPALVGWGVGARGGGREGS